MATPEPLPLSYIENTMLSLENVSGNSSHHMPANPRLANGIIVLVLLVMNVVGNSLVFYVYHYYIKRNVFSLFVRVLAALDLVTAVVMMMDVMIKTRPLDENRLELQGLCKLTHYLVYSISLTNSCVLTIIAYQRYRKICHSTAREISLRHAKLFLLASTVVCFLVCLPFLAVHGRENVKLKTPTGDLVSVAVCGYDEEYNSSPLPVVMSTFLTAVFAIVLILTVTFHVLVHMELRQFEKTASVRREAGPESSVSARDEDGAQMSPVSPSPGGMAAPTFPLDAHRAYLEEDGKPAQDDEVHVPVKTGENKFCHTIQTRMSRAASIFSSGGGGPDSVSGRIYKTFVIITVVFIISYLPHLVVKILNKKLEFDKRELSYVQRFFYDIAYNCPYISTVANAFIYGFRNPDFREHCLMVLTCKCSRRQHRRRR